VSLYTTKLHSTSFQHVLSYSVKLVCGVFTILSQQIRKKVRGLWTILSLLMLGRYWRTTKPCQNAKARSVTSLGWQRCMSSSVHRLQANSLIKEQQRKQKISGAVVPSCDSIVNSSKNVAISAPPPLPHPFFSALARVLYYVRGASPFISLWCIAGKLLLQLITQSWVASSTKFEGCWLLTTLNHELWRAHSLKAAISV